MDSFDNALAKKERFREAAAVAAVATYKIAVFFRSRPARAPSEPLSLTILNFTDF
jgi:hypothetical protein